MGKWELGFRTYYSSITEKKLKPPKGMYSLKKNDTKIQKRNKFEDKSRNRAFNLSLPGRWRNDA